jgi:hypothetical protein
MKKYIKIFLLGLTALYSTGCYKEPDIISEIVDKKGKVPQISIVWLGTQRTVAASLAVAPNLTVPVNTNTFLNFEFTGLESAKEFKVYWAPTSAGTKTLVSTTPAGGQTYDAAIRQYKIAVPIQAPATAGSRVYFGEIVGQNGLNSEFRSATLTITAQ